MTDPRPTPALHVELDRTGALPVGEQIHASLRRAILEGVLRPGDRLPSGRDLAAQLGVARGTIRTAYDRLADENLVFGAGPSGTRVCSQLPPVRQASEARLDGPLAVFNRPYSSAPLPFQMGIPAYDAFPAKVWARMRTRAVRADALAYTTYADPRGEPELRAQIATHLAVSRQIQCHPDQVVVTSGYRQGLTLALIALRAHGRTAWMEEPGYPLGRRALELAGLVVEPISVDPEGLCVEEGTTKAPKALLALVTPGQHAPLGMAMSPSRRHALLDWADASDGWVIEDDYLGELQIGGRAAPALAAGRGAERVIHLGAFSKTISPALGLGFVVAPRLLTERIVEVAAVMAPAPNRTTQMAVSQFLADGHLLRHLRQMKVLYAERRTIALEHLRDVVGHAGMSGLALVSHLPATVDDIALARAARKLGIAPSALSPWYARGNDGSRGFLLSVTNLRRDNVRAACEKLARLWPRNS